MNFLLLAWKQTPWPFSLNDLIHHTRVGTGFIMHLASPRKSTLVIDRCLLTRVHFLDRCLSNGVMLFWSKGKCH